MNERKFSLQTTDGCKRLLALLLCIMFVCSFAAWGFSSNGGKVKIQHVLFDARGAAISAELYYPYGTSDRDKLPAIVVAHGGGMTYNGYRGISEELARRGFVVLSVNTYGAGLSEMPMYDEAGIGIEQGTKNYVYRVSPCGYLDAVDYVRGLKFVDTTRIGMIGHSAGGIKTGNALLLDCGYLTLNDALINLMHEQFGQTFTEDEIYLDADQLAMTRLDDDELKLYTALRDQIRAEYSTKVKSAILLGMTMSPALDNQVVSVGGHDVTRACNVNLAVVGGWYDTFCHLSDEQAAAMYQPQGLENKQWYALDQQTASSAKLGALGDTSVVDNTALAEAVENRAARVVAYNASTHSQEYFTEFTSSEVVRVFEQTLGYNGGDLGSEGASPVNASSGIYKWRAYLNGIAMFAMMASMLPLAMLLTKTKFFAPIIAQPVKTIKPFNKKVYYIVSALTVLYTAFAVHQTNLSQRGIFGITFQNTKGFPLFASGWQTNVLLIWLVIGAIVFIAVYTIFDKKQGYPLPFKSFNIGIKFVNILKTLLLAFVLIVCGYLMLAVIVYIFKQDFSLFQVIFAELRVDNWGTVIRFALTYMPMFLVLAMSINYSVRDDIPEWKDTLITVVVNSLGVWALCLVTEFVLHLSAVGEPFTTLSGFTGSYCLVIMLPVLTYFNRKMYKLTNSIWLGALFNSFLAAWYNVSATGSVGCFAGITVLERLFAF